MNLTGARIEGPTPPLSPALTASSATSSGSQLRSPTGGPYQDPRERTDSSTTSSVDDGRVPKRSATVSSTGSGMSSSSNENNRPKGDFYKTMREYIGREAPKPPVPSRKNTLDSENGSEVMLAYGRDSVTGSSTSEIASPPSEGPSLPSVDEKIAFPSFPPSPPQLPQIPPRTIPKANNRPSVVSISRSISSASAYSLSSNIGGPRGVSRSNPQGVDRRILETLAEDAASTSGDGTFGLSALAMIDPTPPPMPSPPSQSLSITTPRSPVLGAPKRSHTAPTSSSHMKKKGKERVKNCVTCEKKIEGGRWVPVAGTNSKSENDQGVLCEGCWKAMYLPRVSTFGSLILYATFLS